MSGIQLIPIDATTRQILTDRATLTVSTDSPVVFLGDNDSTGIVDPYLGSKVVKLYVKRNKYFAYCLTDSAGHVRLNGFLMQKGGRRELKPGDLLALRSSDSAEDADGDYCYRVGALSAANGITSNDNSIAVAATPTHVEVEETGAATSGNAATAASLPKEVGEEVICAICIEIMVEPTTVCPCGHSFCRLCLAGQSECAECRGPIASHIICRSLQNLIEQLAKLHSSGTAVFDNEDFESYKMRRKVDGTRAFETSAIAAQSARKRRRETRRAAAAAARLRAPSNGEVIMCLDD